jgi:hypothetical protein
MLVRMKIRSNENYGTQLHTIRDLMRAAARRGAWLTLREIAQMTEIGEASISAQLRHLRKRRYGRYLVEKRPRLQRLVKIRLAGGARFARKKRMVTGPVRWEYRVLSGRCRRAVRPSPRTWRKPKG